MSCHRFVSDGCLSLSLPLTSPSCVREIVTRVTSGIQLAAVELAAAVTRVLLKIYRRASSRVYDLAGLRPLFAPRRPLFHS